MMISLEQITFSPNTFGVAKETIRFLAVISQQTFFTSTAMKETIFSTVDTEESVKPSKAVKVMIKSMLIPNSTTWIQILRPCY